MCYARTTLIRIGILIFILSPIVATVEAQATVRISLKKFRDSDSLLWNGDQCTKNKAYCPKLMEFCVQKYPPSPTSFTNCLYYIKTKAPSSNDIDFELTPTNISQDIVLDISSYTGVGLLMNITKGDSLLSPGSLIDTHAFAQHFQPGYNGTTRRHSRVSFGQRLSSRSRLSFTVEVSCSEHYFDDKCSTFCKSTDDVTGHYICDSTGNRVCLKNWYKLPNCLTYCVPHDDYANGHYTCGKTGARVCRPNWYMLPNCTLYCEPKDDDLGGHYTCNTNGTRICRTNWHNHPQCDTFCLAQNDSINGYYTCDNNGTRVCHTNWYNHPKCDTHCFPRNDTGNGHYSCSSNGTHLCHPNWYILPNCTTFCEPEDDDSNGHYICDTRGNHICRYGWTNPPNCTTRSVISSFPLSSRTISFLEATSVPRDATAACDPSDTPSVTIRTSSTAPSSVVSFSTSYSWTSHIFSRSSSLAPEQSISATFPPSLPPSTQVRSWWLWLVETNSGIGIMCFLGIIVVCAVLLLCWLCFCRRPSRPQTGIRSIKVAPGTDIEMRTITS